MHTVLQFKIWNNGLVEVYLRYVYSATVSTAFVTTLGTPERPRAARIKNVLKKKQIKFHAH